MNIIAFVLIVIAGALGAYDLIVSRGRSLYGWAIALMSTGILLDLCTGWAHTVHA